jgi:hypothetical protein
MTTLTKLTSLATAGALILSLAPAFAQETPVQPTEQPHSRGSQEEMMRSMMQDMMEEMMQQREAQAEDDDQEEGRTWRRWHHGRQMGRPGIMRGFVGRGHGARMRIAFALMDADGNGTVTLQEAQDFQARIFSAVDGDKNGGVTMEEIQSFFHGSAEGSAR